MSTIVISSEETIIKPISNMRSDVHIDCEVDDIVTGINECAEVDEILESLCEDDDNVEILLNKIGKDKCVEYFNIQ